MAEPPAIYADLMQLEEDVERLLRSGSELGRNLLAQKQIELRKSLIKFIALHCFRNTPVMTLADVAGRKILATTAGHEAGPHLDPCGGL